VRDWASCAVTVAEIRQAIAFSVSVDTLISGDPHAAVVVLDGSILLRMAVSVPPTALCPRPLLDQSPARGHPVSDVSTRTDNTRHNSDGHHRMLNSATVLRLCFEQLSYVVT
jgi:hypothetical protein